MKKIYICSQYRGDVEANTQNAKEYCSYVVKECGAIPIAPHIYFTQFLDDDIECERAFGIAAGLELLRECDELWYFGDKASQGMVTEIIAAKKLGIPIRYIDPYHMETQSDIFGSSHLWHICEFAERMENNDAVIKPITLPKDFIETNYYCPLTFTIFERNEYGDIEEDACDYDGRVALQYEDKIKELIEKEHSFDGCDEYDIASYQENPKVLGTKWDVEEVNGNLYGCIHVKLSAKLNESEESEFRAWLEGQCSDGFGEGLEQREMAIDDGIGYVSFWKGSDGWCIKNEDEFKNQFKHENTMSMGGM